MAELSLGSRLPELCLSALAALLAHAVGPQVDFFDFCA